MDHDRLTYHIFQYDLQNIANDTWCEELENIHDEIDRMEILFDGIEIDSDIAKE